MPFWRRQKKEAPRSKSKEKPSTITIMHSETLGMTVIEDAPNKNAKFEELSPEEWVEIIDSNKLNGYSFEKIYFSFLKGIPTYL